MVWCMMVFVWAVRTFKTMGEAEACLTLKELQAGGEELLTLHIAHRSENIYTCLLLR